MNHRIRHVIVVPLLVVCSLLFGCKPSKSDAVKAPSPAKVSEKLKEESLAGVVLTPEAEQRLGIATAPAAMKQVQRQRTFGGELIVALGANAAGGSSIYSILPGLTAPEMIRVAEMQVDADGQVTSAKVQVEAAEIALKRAEGLLAEKAGSIRAVDEAKAQVETAKAALQGAQSRRALLGAPLFEAVKQDTLWVRVPVYVGDSGQINASAPAHITSLGNHTNQSSRLARPIQVPVSAANGSATIDLFYQVENKDNALRAGQRVAVQVPLSGEEESLVVPASAIFYDIYGGTWLYENTAPHAFTRRRVEVRYTANDEAVLARGVRPGAKVVTTGAAELFGAETGFSK